MTQRTERVGDLLRSELSELLRREMRDPRVALASVSAVEVARDFSHATVRVSVLGAEAERLAAIAALDKAKGFLRSELARRISLRTTPSLHFVLDRGPERSLEIEAILDGLRVESKKEGESDS